MVRSFWSIGLHTKSLRQNKIMCILSFLKVQQVNEPRCLRTTNPLLSARFYGLLFHRVGKNMIAFFRLSLLLSVSCDKCDAGNSNIKEPKKWFKWVDFSVTPTLFGQREGELFIYSQNFVFSIIKKTTMLSRDVVRQF